MDVAGEYRYQRLTWEEMNEAIAAQSESIDKRHDADRSCETNAV